MKIASGTRPISAGASQSRGSVAKMIKAATMLASASWARPRRRRLGSPVVGMRQESMGPEVRGRKWSDAFEWCEKSLFNGSGWMALEAEERMVERSQMQARRRMVRLFVGVVIPALLLGLLVLIAVSPVPMR